MPDIVREIVQLVISGLAVGSLYALVALGFVLLWKATTVLNFAHGEVMMLGAYFALTLILQVNLPWWMGALGALGLAALVGVFIHYTMVRPMLGQPMFSIVMVTIGLSIVVRSAVIAIWGPEERVFPSPFPTRPIQLFSGIVVSAADIAVLLSAFLCIALFGTFFRLSKLGLHMRAVAESQEVALMMGVNVNKVFAASWAVSALIAAVAGVFMAGIQVLSTTLGSIGLRAFPAAIIGGLESIPGAIVGGLIIGVVESLAVRFVGSASSDIASFSLLLLVLLIRPYGLFGEREIERV